MDFVVLSHGSFIQKFFYQEVCFDRNLMSGKEGRKEGTDYLVIMWVKLWIWMKSEVIR